MAFAEDEDQVQHQGSIDQINKEQGQVDGSVNSAHG